MQHSAPDSHASPASLQRAGPHVPVAPSHPPVQHSASLEHLDPSARHPAAQMPPTQASPPQHSESPMQGAPPGVQMHSPNAQKPAQHCAPS